MLLTPNFYRDQICLNALPGFTLHAVVDSHL